jgi:hypothetical protein
MNEHSERSSLGHIIKHQLYLIRNSGRRNLKVLDLQNPSTGLRGVTKT